MHSKDLSKMAPTRLITIAACLAVFLVCVEFAGIAIALPDISASLSLSFSSIQWCLTGYLMAFGGVILLGGTIGDVIGSRLVLVSATLVFLLGSAICGASQTPMLLIGGRVLQGLAAAFIWPNATSLVYRLAPKGGESCAVSLITGVVGIAMAAGPFVAGYICDVAGWRWFFYINIPICILILICLLSTSISDSYLSSNRATLTETLLLSFSLILLLIVVSIPGSSVLWRIITLICAGIVLYWWRFSRRTVMSDWPIRELFSLKSFTMGCTLRLLVNLAFYSFLYVSGLYLTKSKGLSTFSAGIFFLATTVGLTVCSFLASRLMESLGEGSIAIIGFGTTIFGYINLTTATHHSTPQLLLSFTSLGIGYGLLSPYLFASTMRCAIKAHSGKASALFYMASIFGSLIGSVISTQIVANIFAGKSLDPWGNAYPFVMSVCAIVVVCAALVDVMRK